MDHKRIPSFLEGRVGRFFAPALAFSSSEEITI
jgi:hypothetical protein